VVTRQMSLPRRAKPLEIFNRPLNDVLFSREFRKSQDFLRDLLGSTFPDIKPNALISYVRGQKGKNYPGGGNAIPRKRLNGAGVYCGTVGETLIVGIER
jgi:hypothetical protein